MIDDHQRLSAQWVKITVDKETNRHFLMNLGELAGMVDEEGGHARVILKSGAEIFVHESVAEVAALMLELKKVDEDQDRRRARHKP